MVSYINPVYVAPPAQGVEDERTPVQKREYITIAARSKTDAETGDNIRQGPILYPELGASSFFSSVSMDIDNCPISMEDMRFQPLYQTHARKFSTEKVRTLAYGPEAANLLVPTKNLHEDATYDEAEQAVDSGSEVRSRARPAGARFGFEGCFLLGAPKNLTLCSMEQRGVNNHWTFLPPGTTVSIRLARADPQHAKVGWMMQHGGEDMAPAPLTLAQDELKFPKMKIEITELSLLYEAYDFDRLNFSFPGPDKSLKFYHDGFVTGSSNLMPSTRICTNTFSIPDGTKMLYISYVHHFQIYFDPASGKGNFYKTVFPPNLKKVTFKINEEIVFWPDGLEGLIGDDAAYGSSGAKTLYKFYQDRNMTDRPFETFFPKTAHGSPCDQTLALPVGELKLEGNSTLTLVSKFGSKLSPASGMFVTCVCVTEKVTEKLKGVWKTSDA